MQEVNHDIGDILAIGSDRFKGFANGFAKVCPVAQVIVCKKHAEDDVTKKLTSLGITGEARGKFMKDIFGSETTNEKGLIDCLSAAEFDAKVLHLKPEWKKRKMEARKTSKPEFSHYFDVYLSHEMKEKMILPVRRKVGLGDEFFYDNATESINHRFKVAIRNEKATCNPTGARDLDCTMAEAGEIYYNMLQQTRRNIHRAVIGIGPYRLSDENATCYTAAPIWNTLSDNEKTSRIKMVDPKYKPATKIETDEAKTLSIIMGKSVPDITIEGDQPTKKSEGKSVPDITIEDNQSSENEVVLVDEKTNYHSEASQATRPITSGCNTITSNKRKTLAEGGNSKLSLGDFEKTNLPVIFRGSWSNAEKIVNRQGVGKAPGIQNARVVVSTSNSDFHRVTVTNKNCPAKCDCARFSDLGLCAHILAVAYDEGKLNEVVRNYKPNISTIGQPSRKAGKKPNQSVRKRKSSTTKGKRNVEEFNDPLAHADLINFPDPDNWTVIFVKNTKMRKCYGCGGSVRQDVSIVPPSPWNIVLARREYRVYTPRGKRSIQISAKKEMVYYHPRMKCLREKNTDVTGNQVQVPSDIAPELDNLQRAQLRKEFGLDL